ncbi:hypothetical protein GTP58_08320 [Duganella sp. CY15W]|uniref:hypothetical protein n=1 Tax=Duganella sp. CY15W TaxID=2692172 RepID=UPI00136EB19E|nr:hypothetical protein [Duganella sp. CY15W]MYM28327.1 hypothetical protein [Duganella sp. CY15W]
MKKRIPAAPQKKVNSPTMKIPTFNQVALICDEPELAAQLSAALSTNGTYFPVLDSPRLGRPDAEAEVIRRVNALAEAKPKKVILGGCTERVRQSLDGHVPASLIKRVEAISEQWLTPAGIRLKKGTSVKVSRKNIGAGLLLALRTKRQLEFVDDEPEVRYVPPSAAHLVVCEDGNSLAQIIAANYAYAIGAGLQLISTPAESLIKDINERFYGATEDRHASTTSILQGLARKMREYLKDLNLTGVQSITFITSGIPWGFAVQEMPTTHLFAYPDLGKSIVHGLAATINDGKPLRLIAMIDPGQVASHEVVKAGRSLIKRGPMIIAFRNQRANIRSVSHLIDLVPYDLLFIATHCGDVKGSRDTHRFVDSSGAERTLVLDLALQVSPEALDGKFEVKAFEKFVSIDGVPWEDKVARLQIIGTAVKDFCAVPLGDRTPESCEPIDRIAGSAALGMFDGNLLATPTNAGAGRFPFIFNNACVSWHELAGRFMFGGARGYIGSLISVADSEAQEVAMGVLDKYFGRPLAHALWSTQKEVSGGGIRRPYVMVGLHFQRLRGTLESPHKHILEHLVRAYRYWNKQLSRTPAEDSNARMDLADRVDFLHHCIEEFGSSGSTSAPGPSVI